MLVNIGSNVNGLPGKVVITSNHEEFEQRFAVKRTLVDFVQMTHLVSDQRNILLRPA